MSSKCQLALDAGLRVRSQRGSRGDASQAGAREAVEEEPFGEDSEALEKGGASKRPRCPDGRKCRTCPHTDDQPDPAQEILGRAGSLTPWEADSHLDHTQFCC